MSTFSFASQFHQSIVENLTPPYTARDKDGALYNQTTSSNFKTPQTIVTTAENSAIGNINIIKLEVNPNRMDKTEADIKDKYFDLFGWFCSDQVLEENYFDEKESSVKSNCSANPKVSKGQT